MYKLKSYGDEVKDFCNKEIPKMDDLNHICVVVISLDSALKKNEDYYPQVFLKECKYIEKKAMAIYMAICNFMTMSNSSFSDESDEE